MAEIREAQVYTREEAEALLRVSRSTMMRLIKCGTVRAAKIGGQYRILGAELMRLLLPEPGYNAVRSVYRKGRQRVHEMEATLESREVDQKNEEVNRV